MSKHHKLNSILQNAELNELERSIVERLVQKKKRSIIAKELGILKKKVNIVIAQMRGRGLDIPFSDAERIAAKRNSLNTALDIRDSIEGEQTKIIFNKVTSATSKYILLITDDKELIHQLIKE